MKKKLCTACKEKEFCSVPCEAMNQYLKSCGIRSANWGRNRHKEIPFGSLIEIEHGLAQKETGRKLPINLSYYDKTNE